MRPPVRLILFAMLTTAIGCFCGYGDLLCVGPMTVNLIPPVSLPYTVLVDISTELLPRVLHCPSADVRACSESSINIGLFPGDSARFRVVHGVDTTEAMIHPIYAYPSAGAGRCETCKTGTADAHLTKVSAANR
jgi:hypothetical protein